MPRSDARIPLGVEQRSFSAPLQQLVQARKDDRIDASNLKTADLQQQRLQQQVDAGNQPEPISDARKMDLANKAVLDTVAYLSLLDQGNVKNSALLGQSILTDMKDAEMDTRMMAGVVSLGAENPQEAAKFMRESVMPILRTKISDGLTQGIEEGGKLVGTLNMKTGERTYFEEEEQFTTETKDGALVQTSSTSGREFASPRQQADSQASETFDASTVTESSPASVREFAFRELLTDEEAARFATQERGSQFQRTGSEVIQFGPDGNEIARFDIELAPGEEPETIAAQEEARKSAQLRTQRVFDAGGAQGTLSIVQAQSTSMLAAVDKLIDHPGLKSATGAGAINPLTLGSRIPTTDSNDARILIDQLKDEIFVEALQAIKASSQTGGGVGQVSEKEGDRLENMMGALDRSQSDEQFLSQLKIIRDQVVNMQTLTKNAFDSEFGDINLTGDTELDMILQQIEEADK